MVKFSVYVVWPSILSLNNLQVLKIYKTKAVEKTCSQENFLSADLYIPGLALIGFQTSRPCLQQVKKNHELVSGQLEKSMRTLVTAVIWTRPLEIQLVMVTMRKSIHGFPLLLYRDMGLLYKRSFV